MREVLPARTSPTLHPLPLCINCRDYHFKSYYISEWVYAGMVNCPNVLNSYSASRDNWCTVGGDGGCRVGKVRAGTTSHMPDHKGFKLQ